MDDQHDFRGWDLWIESGRVGTHIINKWPDDALKVVAKNPLKAGQWNHVFVTYDGSGKAAGVKIYVNGVPQDDRRRGRHSSRARSAPTVPLKIGQRHTTSRLDDVGAAGPAHLRPGAVAATEVEQLAAATRAAWLVGEARRQAHAGGEERAVRLVAGRAWTRRISELAEQAGRPAAGRGGDQGARHHRPRHAGAARASRRLTSCSAAITTSAATR